MKATPTMSPRGSESHFKVVCVSASFKGLLKVKRHQKLYSLLDAQLKAGVHALAMHLYTEAEWSSKQQAPQSPDCMGAKKG